MSNVIVTSVVRRQVGLAYDMYRVSSLGIWDTNQEIVRLDIPVY